MDLMTGVGACSASSNSSHKASFILLILWIRRLSEWTLRIGVMCRVWGIRLWRAIVVLGVRWRSRVVILIVVLLWLCLRRKSRGHAF
jgi:hypothetical protein